MPEDSALETPGRSQQVPRLVVVGIGAVRASIPSVGCVLARLPAQSRLAVLIVVQDHQPDDLPGISATLARAGRLPVEVAADGLQPQRGHVYLVPAGALLTLEGARLRVGGDGDRGALDTFLRSLAEQHGKYAIGIALAGLGDDGTLGLAAVRLNGGLAMAELTMPADQIGRHIVAHVDRLGSAVRAIGLGADIQPDHGAAHLRDEHVRRLESELHLTKDRLSEASRRGWEDRDRGGYSARGRDDDDYRRYTRSRRDDDDDGRGHGRGGWFGDPEGHSEASRRGWDHRR